MSDITNRICATCRRVIEMDDLSINEGKPYHDHCLLQSTRGRIAFLIDKGGRKTATILDAEELQDTMFVEERMKADIEAASKFKVPNNEKPVFKGNTPLGLHSAMNSPAWKKILAKKGNLDGTKYHMHKDKVSEPTTEPIWQITTDENGHKGVIQTGTRPIQSLPETKKEELSSGQTSALVVQNKELIDYEAERIKIDIWRGFELLDKLIPSFNILDMNARVATLNRERNQGNISMVVA